MRNRAAPEFEDCNRPIEIVTGGLWATCRWRLLHTASHCGTTQVLDLQRAPNTRSTSEATKIWRARMISHSAVNDSQPASTGSRKANQDSRSLSIASMANGDDGHRSDTSIQSSLGTRLGTIGVSAPVDTSFSAR